MVRYHTIWVCPLCTAHVSAHMSILVLQSLMRNCSWSPSNSNLREHTHSKSKEIGPQHEIHLDDFPMVGYEKGQILRGSASPQVTMVEDPLAA